MNRLQNQILVIGNRAGDLDSTVCTIAMAQLLSLTENVPVIPLMRKTRNFLSLNPEIPSLLSYAAYNREEIVFQETPAGRVLVEDPETLFFLVDHNEPEGIGGEAAISGIIDHHRDSGYKPSLAVRIIDSCGSCASLVSREWKKRGCEMTRETALLLGAAIIVDTGDFNPDWGKSTELDIREFRRLESFFSEKDSKFLRSLLTIKNDLSHLSLMDHLRRDYKEIPGTGMASGICSIPVRAEDFFHSPFFRRKKINQFLQEQNLDHLFILHTTQDPFRRQLSLYISTDSPLRLMMEELCERLLDLSELRLKPTGLKGSLPAGWINFSQEETRASRKVVLPLLQDLLKSLNEETL